MDGGSSPPQPLAAAGDAGIPQLRARFEEQAAAAGDRAAWEALRLAWLGRKQGVLRDLLSERGFPSVHIPTQLHPRINPLMTSSQVFTEQGLAKSHQQVPHR